MKEMGEVGGGLPSILAVTMPTGSFHLPHCKSSKIKFQTYNLKLISLDLYFKIYVCILVSHDLLKVQKNSRC